MTRENEAKLRKAFESSLIVEFDPKMKIEKLVGPTALIIVAGGDGTIGWVVRRLAETKHPLGIISMGTFNNFAKSLHLPTTVDEAIAVIKTGKPHPITLGRLNDKIFLEAKAGGRFYERFSDGEQFAHRHDSRANPIAEFPSLGNRIGHALQLIDESVESRIGNDA